jgi:hypothetical protein
MSKGYTVWTFTFYRPKDRWIPTGFDYNDNIEPLFNDPAASGKKPT